MRVQGSGFRVEGSGFRVWGLGFGVWGLGFGGLGFGVWGLGFGATETPLRALVDSFGPRYSPLLHHTLRRASLSKSQELRGIGFRIAGLGFGVLGLGFGG